MIYVYSIWLQYKYSFFTKPHINPGGAAACFRSACQMWACTSYYKMAYGRPTGSRTSDRPRRGGVDLDSDDDDDGGGGGGDGCGPGIGINRSVSIARRPSRRHRVTFHEFRRDVPYRCFFLVYALCEKRHFSRYTLDCICLKAHPLYDIIKTILIHLHTPDLYVPI